MSHEAAANALNGRPSADQEAETMLSADEAEEEIDQDEDTTMDSGDEDDEQEGAPQEEEISLQNDSIAHIDAHAGNSIFAIAQHPLHPSIIATGGGEDDEEKEEGFGFVFDISSAPTNTQPGQERASIQPLQRLGEHTDSITSVAFSLPTGDFLITAGMDGRAVAYQHQRGKTPPYAHLSTVQEVEEVTFLEPCPHPDHPHTFALGASDGSVWVYTIDPSDKANPLQITQTYYIHTSRVEAGAWTPDGQLLATVSEDGSLYVWDVFGEAAGAGMTAGGMQYVVGLTGEDERFRVDGGLYSVAVSPNGAFVAVGGAEGQIRVVGLPRFGAEQVMQGGKGGGGAKSKAGGGKQAGDKTGSGQAGMILASLGMQANSVETLAFANAPLTLLASGSSDGSIAVFDTSKNFSLRRKIPPQSGAGEAGEEGDAITQVSFVEGKGSDRSWLLTSCGFDGVLRRWDLRSAGSGSGLVGEWRGHRGAGEGGYVQGFVQGLQDAQRVVTAGDDGVVLMFDMERPPA